MGMRAAHRWNAFGQEYAGSCGWHHNRVVVVLPEKTQQYLADQVQELGLGLVFLGPSSSSQRAASGRNASTLLRILPVSSRFSPVTILPVATNPLFRMETHWRKTGNHTCGGVRGIVRPQSRLICRRKGFLLAVRMLLCSVLALCHRSMQHPLPVSCMTRFLTALPIYLLPQQRQGRRQKGDGR